MEAVQAAYLAGIVDGEGTISLVAPSAGRNRWFYARLSVSNTCFPLLERFLEWTGSGAITLSRRDYDEHPSWKKGYNWACGSGDLEQVLREIAPHLLIKREHAEIVLQYLSLRREAERIGRELSPDAVGQARELYWRVRELNRKGRRLALDEGQSERLTFQERRAGAKTPAEVEAKILELLKQGDMPAEKIGEATGVSRSVVRRVAAENRIQTRYPAGDQHWMKQRAATGEGSRAVKCEACGDFFETTHPRQKFCSLQCQYDERNERRRKDREEFVRTAPPVERNCSECGVRIESPLPRQKFCEQCRKRRKLQGEHERYARDKERVKAVRAARRQQRTEAGS